MGCGSGKPAVGVAAAGPGRARPGAGVHIAGHCAADMAEQSLLLSVQLLLLLLRAEGATSFF